VCRFIIRRGLPTAVECAERLRSIHARESSDRSGDWGNVATFGSSLQTPSIGAVEGKSSANLGAERPYLHAQYWGA
jgi:hypothetical protein